MRAIICKEWGSVDDLTMEDVPPPVPADDEILIEVKATSANFADSIMIAGKYQTKPDRPFSPGLEASGIVLACGKAVTNCKPGDRVMAMLAYGGYAEQAIAKTGDTFVIPDAMSFEDAATFPVAYMSSHVAIRWEGRLQPGETLLVLGAAGGVGLTAVEIGKAMGARVIAGASSAEKLAAAGAHGADDGINYGTESLKDRVMALTDDKGVDVCFDPFVGGIPQIPANRLLVKNRAALGSSLRHFRWHQPDKLRQSVDELFRWYEEGKLHPLITHRLPLERTVDAIKLLTGRQAFGKVVVTP